MIPLLLSLLGMLAMFQPPAPAPLIQEVPATRQVQVEVTVRKNGEPFAGVPLALDSKARDSRRYAVTSEQGTATAQVNVPVADARVRARLGRPFRAPDETIKARTASLEAAFLMLRQYTFRDAYIASVDPSENRVAITIDVSDALTATFALERDGQPFMGQYFAFAPPRSPYAIKRADGVVEVGGLEPNTPATVYVVADNGTIVRVPIPALAQSTTLPPVTIPRRSDDAQVSVTALNQNKLDGTFESSAPGITLVSLEGSCIVSFADQKVDRDGQAYGELPKVPAGTYWVAPLMFMSREAQVRLIERVVAGEDLTASGIPRLTATVDGVAELTFDAVAVEKAILAMPQKQEP